MKNLASKFARIILLLLLTTCLSLTAGCAATEQLSQSILSLVSGDQSAAPGATAQNVDITADAKLLHQAVQTTLGELYDNYATYYTTDEYALMYDDYQGVFGGVGISMTNVDDYVVVYSIIDNTPASRSEIQAGDRIVAVNGESIIGFDTDEAALLIRGDIGSTVALSMENPDTLNRYTVTLAREEITNESVSAQMLDTPANTAYFQISQFTEHSATEFAESYNTLTENNVIDNIILDLRSNGGGSFHAAINIANFFVPADDVIVSEKTSDGEQSYTSNSGQLYGVKLYILQNEWTASASEVLAGALRDEAGATLIGSVSFGKGITQSLIELDSGSALRFTRSRYYTPSGYDLHGVGIIPDVDVAIPDDVSYDDYWSVDPELNEYIREAVKLIDKQ